jgi:hypothetical protein
MRDTCNRRAREGGQMRKGARAICGAGGDISSFRGDGEAASGGGRDISAVRGAIGAIGEGGVCALALGLGGGFAEPK